MKSPKNFAESSMLEKFNAPARKFSAYPKHHASM